MARPAAQAVGLFYPTPAHLIAAIAALITVGAGESYSIVDPCAADGAAVIDLTKALFPARASVEVYACELERTRYDALAQRRYGHNFKLTPTHGDAMRLVWSTEETYGGRRTGASLAFINPPYDHDPEFKRLEERFLRRFASCLAPHGVLVWLVPYYSMSASADTLAREFSDLKCYRFPEPDFDVFKQVVLIGTKRPTLTDPDPAVRAQVLRWAAGVDEMPVLGSHAGVVEMPGHGAYKAGFSVWRVVPLDVTGLLSRFKPWHASERSGRLIPISGVVPRAGDLLARTYPLAVPPKPAHLAAAIASGVFNGAEVRPDDPASHLPRLRVKGVFHKEFVTVDEKKNKDDEKTGEVQVQQPRLVVTVLDVARGVYHTLKSSAECSGSTDPATMTTGDLLTHYGRGLMRVMLEQCPVLHDPSDPAQEIQLPPLARTLYRAQAHAVMAIIKLISPEFEELRRKWDPRRDGAPENALLLGMIGVGKSSVADAAFEYMRVKGYANHALVMCPPHLLQGWKDQVKAVTPHLPTTFLESVGDVDKAATDTQQGVYVMSREAAKLSHAYMGVTGPCPKCGGSLPIDEHGIAMSPGELARKRVKCTAITHNIPRGRTARLARELALLLMLVAPRSPDVNQLVRGRMRDKMMVRAAGRLVEGKTDTALWLRKRPALAHICERVAGLMVCAARERCKLLGDAFIGLLAALNNSAVATDICERLYLATAFDTESYGVGSVVRDIVRSAMLLIQDRAPLAACLEATGLHVQQVHYGAIANVWQDGWLVRSTSVAAGKDDPESYHSGIRAGTWNKHAFGSAECAVEALGLLTKLGDWRQSRTCGEHLYQAVPDPRRVALAKYLSKRAPHVVDMLIADEAHEFGNGDSAQSQAAHRIVGMGVPTIALTGSVMNGYAVSLYANQQAMDPIFREEFPRRSSGEGDEKRESGSGLRDFNRRYGYIKQFVQQTDKEGKVVEWGSQSERKETAKEIGNAPGVLPLFVLKYLLRTAVPLQMADLAIDLPPHHEIVEHVEPDPGLKATYARLIRALKDQIKEDRFNPDLAGKLFGAMAEIGSYLDRATADTGNVDGGAYEVRYPDGCDGGLVASAAPLPASTILPKERWMLSLIEREFKAGRRVMIFGWHELVLPRLARLVEKELSEPCALLLSKVQAKKRQDWIDQHVIGKKRRVVVLNPACVKTGLNNLVWFQSTVWMENPAVDPQTKRQADGRIDRIGKTAESRWYGSGSQPQTPDAQGSRVDGYRWARRRERATSGWRWQHGCIGRVQRGSCAVRDDGARRRAEVCARQARERCEC